MVNFYSTVKSGPTQEQLEVLTKLYDSGKNELILSKLETLLKSFPNDPALLTLKGLVYDALLNHSKALACYDKIIKKILVQSIHFIIRQIRWLA